MKPCHILIDLETLGTKPGAVILSIGATAFRFGEPFDHYRDTFYRRIDLATSASDGLTIDAETLQWWLGQGQEARYAAFHEGPAATPLSAALALADWMGGSVESVYGNSPSFDLDLLSALFEAVGRPVPWKYWQERCVRTELAMCRRLGVPVDEIKAGIAAEFPGLVKHRALDDAIAETELLLRCWAAVPPLAASRDEGTRVEGEESR